MLPLVDTNVLSELARRKPSPGVLKWARRTWHVALSSITVEELRFGLAWRPRPRVEAWLHRFLEQQAATTPTCSLPTGEPGPRILSRRPPRRPVPAGFPGPPFCDASSASTH